MLADDIDSVINCRSAFDDVRWLADLDGVSVPDLLQFDDFTTLAMIRLLLRRLGGSFKLWRLCQQLADESGIMPDTGTMYGDADAVLSHCHRAWSQPELAAVLRSRVKNLLESSYELRNTGNQDVLARGR